MTENRTSTARVSTARPGRYAKQLASHFGRMVETHWSEAEGRGDIVFDGPIPVSLVAGDGVLLMTVSASETDLDRVERIVGTHLERFGRADDLSVQWHRS
ncbi:DUF2218 domain-containing protein [Staphylococcus chromogenes]|nr:DUF2218 domain-containing protein [Staphylococcus chromogenes]